MQRPSAFQQQICQKGINRQLHHRNAAKGFRISLLRIYRCPLLVDHLFRERANRPRTKDPPEETDLAESSSRKSRKSTQRNRQPDPDSSEEEHIEEEETTSSDEDVIQLPKASLPKSRVHIRQNTEEMSVDEVTTRKRQRAKESLPKSRVQIRQNMRRASSDEETTQKKQRRNGYGDPRPSTYIFQGNDGNHDFDFDINGTTAFDADLPELDSILWGEKSAQLRRKFPMVVPTPNSLSNYDRIELRHDPDDMTIGPIAGRICYIVVRGYMFVVLPSRVSDSLRAVLVRGRDYSEAKQRFIAGQGMVVSSTPPSYLSGTSWKNFWVNNVATTPNGNMTLIEGFVNQKGWREMKVFSLSTLRDAYGAAEADALVLERRAKVGQKRLARRQKRLPADVLEYLAERNLEL